MKKLTIILLSALAFACSEETVEPSNKTQPIMETPEQTQETGCGAVITKNAHSDGETITIKAEYPGYIPEAVLLVETRDSNGAITSSYRKPTARKTTEQTIAFAAKGKTLYLGVFPCGGTGSASGAAYTMHITQGGKTTTVNAKVGNTIEYIVTH